MSEEVGTIQTQSKSRKTIGASKLFR